jgi:hypothetical protein
MKHIMMAAIVALYSIAAVLVILTASVVHPIFL